MTTKKWMVCCVLILVSHMSVAQDEEDAPPPAIPGTEIFLADISVQGDEIKVGEPMNVTREKGYDSQPSFGEDNKLYYTSYQGNRTNIWVYDVLSKKSRAYHNSAESEYSPTPLKNKKGISVVRVDFDGDQHVYFMQEHGTKPELFSELKQVGYHAWHGDLLWTFVLSDSPSGGDLHATLPGQEAIKVYKNIGRTLTVDEKTGYLYFIDKSPTPWQIKRIHGVHEQPKHVIDLPAGVEDFARDSQGRFWLGQGDRLYTSTEKGEWRQVAEFKLKGFSGITRLAVNPSNDKLAFVLNETE